MMVTVMVMVMIMVIIMVLMTVMVHGGNGDGGRDDMGNNDGDGCDNGVVRLAASSLLLPRHIRYKQK